MLVQAKLLGNVQPQVFIVWHNIETYRWHRTRTGRSFLHCSHQWGHWVHLCQIHIYVITVLTVLQHRKSAWICLVVCSSWDMWWAIGCAIHYGIHLIVEPHNASPVSFISLPSLEGTVKVLEVFVLGVALLPVAFNALLHQPVGDLDEDVSLSSRALQLPAHALVWPDLDQRSHFQVAPVSTCVWYGDHVELIRAGWVCDC